MPACVATSLVVVHGPRRPHVAERRPVLTRRSSHRGAAGRAVARGDRAGSSSLSAPSAVARRDASAVARRVGRRREAHRPRVREGPGAAGGARERDPGAMPAPPRAHASRARRDLTRAAPHRPQLPSSYGHESLIRLPARRMMPGARRRGRAAAAVHRRRVSTGDGADRSKRLMARTPPQREPCKATSRATPARDANATCATSPSLRLSRDEAGQRPSRARKQRARALAALHHAPRPRSANVAPPHALAVRAGRRRRRRRRRARRARARRRRRRAEAQAADLGPRGACGARRTRRRVHGHIHADVLRSRQVGHLPGARAPRDRGGRTVQRDPPDVRPASRLSLFRYMSPEIAAGGQYNASADEYSRRCSRAHTARPPMAQRPSSFCASGFTRCWEKCRSRASARRVLHASARRHEARARVAARCALHSLALLGEASRGPADDEGGGRHGLKPGREGRRRR